MWRYNVVSPQVEGTLSLFIQTFGSSKLDVTKQFFLQITADQLKIFHNLAPEVFRCLLMKVSVLQMINRSLWSKVTVNLPGQLCISEVKVTLSGLPSPYSVIRSEF